MNLSNELEKYKEELENELQKHSCLLADKYD